MKESRLVYECMQELGRHGAIFRTNSGQFYTKSGQRIGGLPKGFSDLLFVGNDGVSCFIECKLPGNKASPEQEAFLEKMAALGARSGIAYSINDALRICNIETKS